MKEKCVRLSRRTVLGGIAAGAGAALIGGCGGTTGSEGGGGGVGATQRPRTFGLNADLVPVAVEDGQNVNYVASVTDIGFQAAYWGTQQANGDVKDFIQALVWDKTVDDGVRARFDGRGLPVQVIREDNGAFATCFFEAGRAVFKFYQASGNYIGGAAVTGNGPNFTVTQLTDSIVAGLFVGALQGATDGVFSVTLGGATLETQTPRIQGHRPTGSRPSKAPANLRAALLRITQVASDVDFPASTKALFSSLLKEYRASGASALFTKVVSTALTGTGLSGLFKDNGLSILRGILVNPLVREVALDFVAKLDGGTDLVGKKLVSFPISSPGLTAFISTSALPQAKEASDGTAVSGVIVAREFGSIPLSGVIDASKHFSATGSSGGTNVNISGDVNGTDVTGNWSYTESARAGGGSFGGAQQPLGQCQTQQLSGGQGTFTNTYDLGECGRFTFSYQAYTIPDHFKVLNDGKTIFDTGGLVSGGTSVNLYVSGSSTLVTVVVLASEDGTAWDYVVGCPS